MDAEEWKRKANQTLEMRKKSRRDTLDAIVRATSIDGAIQRSIVSKDRFNYESHLVHEKTGDDLRPLCYVAPEPDQEYRLVTIGGPHLRLQAFQFLLAILSEEIDPLQIEALPRVMKLEYENIQNSCNVKLEDVFDAEGVQSVIDAICEGRKPQIQKLRLKRAVDPGEGKRDYEALFKEDLSNVHKDIKECRNWFTETNSLLIQLSRNGSALRFEDIHDVRELEPAI